MTKEKNTATRLAFVRNEMIEASPPPLSQAGVIAWMRNNLFSSIPYTILTLLTCYFLYMTIPPLVKFVFIDGVWTGDSRSVCATIKQGGIQPDGWFGGCWIYVGHYYNQFIYGRYPIDQQWRVDLVALFFFGGLIPMLIPSAPFKRENIAFMLIFVPVASFILLTGGALSYTGFLLPKSWITPGFTKFLIDYAIITLVVLAIVFFLVTSAKSKPLPSLITATLIMAAIFIVMLICAFDFGLEHVETEKWGGLLVTMVIAVTGIAVSLPLGILLALGRRSQMSMVKVLSIIFIEFWRGVPLITVLFMSSVMLPIFLSKGVSVDKLLRALIGVALFSSAYMAENVRGGLQALPKGQYEGAMALGLNWSQMMRLVVLPQALKMVIPGIVNTFISLFKDTTLVSIIGLFDFLGQIQSSFTDPTWASRVQAITGYLFAAFIYFIFCFSMSRYSLFMEDRLNTGHKR